MVTVTGFQKVETEEGEVYVRLILSGDLEMVESTNTGQYYATTRKATMSCTFDEGIAEHMIGKVLPGEIVKVEVAPYEYTLDSGETIEMAHRWVFVPGEDNVGLPSADSKVA